MALVHLTSCTTAPFIYTPAHYQQDSAAVFNFIHIGDSIYSKKANYNTFYRSLAYYDSAYTVAITTGDSALLAVSLYAKGRAFDAINSNPQKTIDYYTKAANLYKNISGEQQKALYIKHLVAHSYDKVQDSANCIKVLRELYVEIINKPDSVKSQLHFTSEMALISTAVNNYSFADSILVNISKRQWIANNLKEYDYLNHYYLCKAKIDIIGKGFLYSAFIDSVENVFRSSPNLSDSMYYSSELVNLYKKLGNKPKEVFYLIENNNVFNKFNSPDMVRETQDKMAKMELAAIEERKKNADEIAEKRKIFLYLLTGLVGVISILAIVLHKRNRTIRQKKSETDWLNNILVEKNQQNELLNKEIHHRVKNNLQMIMSLVYMQERNTKTNEAKENLQNIRLRIEGISDLHQQLMEQAEKVDLKKYVHLLVNNVSNLLGLEKDVTTHLDIEAITVPQKIGFPLGLILNEWVTNSVKHAILANDFIAITIHIQNFDNNIIVHYRDNGVAQNLTTEKKSLGLDIVKLLIAQLKGTLVSSPNNRYDYTLTIPATNGK